MNVSRQFIADFNTHAGRYGWTSQEIEETKQATRENPDLKRYWAILAAAHRAGYEQTAANNYIRLQAWCLEQGLSDPFGPDFDLAALDAMAIPARGVA